MKKLIGVLLIVMMQSFAYAHCGSCGGGSSDHSHHNQSNFELSAKQEKMLKKINDKYEMKFKKLNKDYDYELSKVVGVNNVKTYRKKYCLKSKKMIPMDCCTKNKKENKKCSSCEK